MFSYHVGEPTYSIFNMISSPLASVVGRSQFFRYTRSARLPFKTTLLRKLLDKSQRNARIGEKKKKKIHRIQRKFVYLVVIAWRDQKCRRAASSRDVSTQGYLYNYHSLLSGSDIIEPSHCCTQTKLIMAGEPKRIDYQPKATWASDWQVLKSMMFADVKGSTQQERLESFYVSQADLYDSYRCRMLHGRFPMV
jgi:hypothetical protein